MDNNLTNKYTIKYPKIPGGVQTYEFFVGGDFYKIFYPQTEILDADIKLIIEVKKEEKLMFAKFNFSGYFELACDRCLQPCKVPINGNHTLIFKSKFQITTKNDLNEDIIFIDENTDEIDISEYIYELSMLMLPAKRIHEKNQYSSDECDEEMIKLLEKFSTSKPVDKRWNSLSSIKLN